MLRPTAALVIALGLIPVAASAQFEPVWPEAEPEITSAILSRSSITVRSIEESLKLYRDILGMTVFYTPPPIFDPRLVAFSGLKPDQKLRLVVLRTETDGAAKLNAGYLGLAEILEADGTAANLTAARSEPAIYGAIGFLFVVENTREIHDQVVAAGFEVISAPVEKDDGSHTQLLMRGPSGERLWITEGERRSVFLQQRPAADDD